MCPYYMMYGMTYDEFWHESLDRLEAYWQKRQFEIESKNQEMWLQGLYNRAAIGAALNKKNKYPEKPQRITEMTESEQDAENRRKVNELREVLMARKQRWEAKRKEADAS